MNIKRLIHKFLTTLLPLSVAAFLCTQNASALTFPAGWVVDNSISGPYFRFLNNGNGSQFGPWIINNGYSPAGTGWRGVSGFELRDSDNTNLVIPGNSIYSIQLTMRNCGLTGWQPGTDYDYIRYIGADVQMANHYQLVRGDTNITTLYFYSARSQAVQPSTLAFGMAFNCNTPNNGDAWLRVNSFTTFSKPVSSGGGSSIDYTSAIQDVVSAVNDLDTSLSSLETQIVALNTKIQNQTQQQQTQYEQPRTEANNANNSAGTQGSASSSDAAQTGSTLLSGVTALVSALNVTPASSCVIDMDLGIADFGEADLCHLSPPPAFQVISSLVVIGFAVPLALAAAHKMIELFRSFA